MIYGYLKRAIGLMLLLFSLGVSAQTCCVKTFPYKSHSAWNFLAKNSHAHCATFAQTKPSYLRFKYVLMRRVLICKIRALGAEVIERGDHLLIVLPADDFFDDIKRRCVFPDKLPIFPLIANLILLQDPSFCVLVMGFSDNVGTRADNLMYSRYQAADVATLLSLDGVDRRRIIAKAYRDRLPIASNRYREGRAFNRRVEITI